ncbi:MAG: hypothetical protein NWP82_03800 [Flavobacteriales bacterium]|nr:hypothetical protein [Flavobacteriales bacterium]MDP5075586.1 hypothetical protein [Flavobacteriales bacterium]
MREGIFFIQNGGKLPVWVAAPTYPSKKTTLSKIARMNKARLTNKLVANPDVIVYFENATYGSASALRRKYPKAKIINVNCPDISKERVHVVHLEALGYSMNLNPKTYIGVAVEKSDENAVHDGQEVVCPVAYPKTDAVYQKVLDNTNEAGEYVDIRVPVIAGKIPLVYLKFKTLKNRFTNKAHRATLHKPEDLFSEEEISQIEKYAAAMKVDFCEFDVLRHNGNKKIYIIDVNKTPYGPPEPLNQKDKAIALKKLSDAFMQLINSKL